MGSTNKKLILSEVNKFIFKILKNNLIFGHSKIEILTLRGVNKYNFDTRRGGQQIKN